MKKLLAQCCSVVLLMTLGWPALPSAQAQTGITLSIENPTNETSHFYMDKVYRAVLPPGTATTVQAQMGEYHVLEFCTPWEQRPPCANTIRRVFDRYEQIQIPSCNTLRQSLGCLRYSEATENHGQSPIQSVEIDLDKSSRYKPDNFEHAVQSYPSSFVQPSVPQPPTAINVTIRNESLYDRDLYINGHPVRRLRHRGSYNNVTNVSLFTGRYQFDDCIVGYAPPCNPKTHNISMIAHEFRLIDAFPDNPITFLNRTNCPWQLVVDDFAYNIEAWEETYPIWIISGADVLLCKPGTARCHSIREDFLGKSLCIHSGRGEVDCY